MLHPAIELRRSLVPLAVVARACSISLAKPWYEMSALEVLVHAHADFLRWLNM